MQGGSGSMEDVSWRELISQAMGWAKDPGPIVACTLDDAELDAQFDDSYGTHEGKSFTAWTETRVYFPVVYDGSEWVGSAPRNPCDEATSHQGGE